MGLLHPELLLLLVPALYFWWRWRGHDRIGAALRLIVLLLLALALAGPYRDTSAHGRDLVLVVDRSRSMPAGSDALALEQIRLAEQARGSGDRVAVVAFGRDALIERLPSSEATFGGFQREPEREASDLGRAIDCALSLIPLDRPGSILLVSDGESNGALPLPAARRALARGIAVHVKPARRETGDTLSVYDLDLPAEVAQGEPFQIAAWVWAEAPVEAELVLAREGKRIAAQKLKLQPGANRALFRDVLSVVGTASYRLSASVEQDSTPENNEAVGALRVGAPRSVLLVNHDGAEDSLAQVLRAAGLDLRVAAPENAPLDRLSLSNRRAVILENVAADRLAAHLDILREFVVERGGGLMLTGGKASFGLGGYYLSSIDEILPVSMEMRQEWRKQGVAIAFALDRSGSMAAPAGANLTKMDLANQGTIAAINLLSPMDSCAVIAVDSSDHTIVELMRVEDPGEIAAQVSGIVSEGGGIFVRTAIFAAAKALEEAEQANRHVVLFADAADAEEPEGVVEKVKELYAAGITTSVIAMGTEQDVDAQFLIAVAAAGGAEISFSAIPEDLPRIFARDTLKVARSTFVQDPTQSAPLPGMLGIGDWLPKNGPALDGYNLTWLRSKATAGLVTSDDYHAPLFAFRHLGLGRTAAFMGEIGGTYGAGVVAWDGFAPLFVSAVRWLAGPEDPNGLYTAVRREGAEAVVSVEVDPQASDAPNPAGMRVRLDGPDGRTVGELSLARVGDGRFEARIPLREQGVHLGEVVLADDRFVSLPPVSLPYSPELERQNDLQGGERLLERVARESGGSIAPPVADLMAEEALGRAWKPLGGLLALIALALFLVEIAARRLQLYGFVRVPRWLANVLARLRGRAPARTVTHASAHEAVQGAKEPQPSTTRSPDAPASVPASATVTTARPKDAPSLSDALSKARKSAGRRLDR